LAAEHGIGDWPQVWRANAGRAEPGGASLTDPDYLEPGWTITIPTLPGPTDSTDPTDSAATGADPAAGGTGMGRVVVRDGDTLSGIAAAHGADLDAVIAANTGAGQPGGEVLTDPDHIEPGWTITLPIPAAPAQPAGADSASPSAPQPASESATPPPAPSGTDSDPSAAPTSSAAPSVIPPTASAGSAGSAPSPTGLPSSGQVPAGEAAPVHSAPASTPLPSSLPSSSSSGVAPFAVFVGGGGVLAALLLAALVRARRRQLQHRRPGEVPPAAPVGLLEMERALRSVGGAKAADAQWLDEALRGLGQLVAASDGALSLPDVLAVCVTDDRLRLVLATPGSSPVGAWTTQPDGSWTLDRGEPTGYQPERRNRDVTPYPALATVGYTAAGEHWLLDLERIGALTLTGDAQRAANLARFLAAELAHNSWAELLQVTLVGFGAEMAQMHPDRLTYAADPAAALAMVNAQLRSVGTVIDESGLPVLDGRSRGIAGEAWAPHVLLIAPDAIANQADRAGLTALLDAVLHRGDRAAVALVVTTTEVFSDAASHTSTVHGATAGDPGGSGGSSRGNSGPGNGDNRGWVLRVDEHGVLSIPELGLELIAQSIPAEQAGQLAQLLALAASTDRATSASPLPEDMPASTRPRREPEDARWARADSALPLPERVYLEQTATTAEDLQAMAPVVQADVREQLAATDQDLDADVTEWTDPASPRPRIAVLGPVTVSPRGGTSPRPLSPMKAEIAVYLAMHPTGVSPEQYGTDLWPDDPDIAGSTKLRTSIYELRRAMGLSARTGTDYLPRNAATNGALYRLEDVLVDAELFRRLRLRGFTRDEQDDRMADWWRALRLVRGAPFDNLRPGGYGWLAGRPVDHQYTATIIDLAHTVATHHLAAGEPDRAEAAAKIAVVATRGVENASDISLLDLVWACDAQDRRAEGDAHVKQILRNHTTDDLEGVPPRTYDVLRRRQFLPPAA
jgi:LysM repeat protein